MSSPLTHQPTVEHLYAVLALWKYGPLILGDLLDKLGLPDNDEMRQLFSRILDELIQDGVVKKDGDIFSINS